jgi:hypothetical protein
MEEDMPKRFSILAAAFVASGRSLSTTSLDTLGARAHEDSSETNVPPTGQSGKPIFDGLDGAFLRSELASTTCPRELMWAA